MANKGKFDFIQQWLNDWENKKDSIADKVGDTALNFFLKEFDNHQWTDRTTTLWQPLAQSTLKFKARKGYGSTPLVNTGDLRKALKDSKLKSSWKGGVNFRVESDYASYHNDGGSTPGRPPQRQFIGPSYELDKEIKQVIEDELKKIFK